MGKLKFILLSISLLLLILLNSSCDNPVNPLITGKVSSQLLAQINLKQAQIDNPTPERLKLMQEMGINTDNLQSQRIFIYLSRELTPSQITELKAMGITFYPDSWIPPLSNHPTGYLIADMPIAKLAELTQKDYVVRLDTAETQLQPPDGAKPQ